MNEHMSLSDYRKLVGTDFDKKNETPSKYHNVKTTVDGIEFDSKAEAARYSELKILKKAGVIRSFARQPSFLFSSGIRYRPDFIVWGLAGAVWVEDVKGVKTKEFLLKQKIWKSEYPDMELRIIE